MAIQDYDIISLVRAAKKRKDEDYWVKTRGEEAFDKILLLFENDFHNLSLKFFINGADRQDVIQECRLGMVNAVDDFDESGGMNFRSFSLHVCIKRHLLTALSAANRKKFNVHNNAVSLDTPIITGDDYTEQTLSDIMPDSQQSLLENIIVHEEYNSMFQELYRRCTALEKRVLEAYSPDESYKEMAEHTQSKAKTVDNALMRIRKKAEEIKKEFDNQQKIEQFKLKQFKKTKEKFANLPENPPALSTQEEVKVIILNAILKFENIKKEHPELSESSLMPYLSKYLTPIEEALFIAYYSGEELKSIESLYKEVTQTSKQMNQNTR